MGNINPVCIPRNHILEAVISEAKQAGNLASFNELLQVLQDPFNPKWMGTIYAMGPDSDQLVLRTFCGT
jgi:uncharacterized protein YdiU (UPF0061 family)